MLAAVEVAEQERRKSKAQLKAKDMKIKGLGEELKRVKKERRA